MPLYTVQRTSFPGTIDRDASAHGVRIAQLGLLACMALTFTVVFWAPSVDAAQLRPQHQVLLSVNSLAPAGLYGSTLIDPSGLEYVYPYFGLAGVFTGSLPVAAPKARRSVFARFETTGAGRKLVFRQLSDGKTNRVVAIEGYNPQWFPDGQTLFFEAYTSEGAALWSIEAEAGLPKKLFDMRSQYYPAAQPSGAAVLSPTGTEAIYHKFISSPRSLLTPMIVDLKTKKEHPLLVDSPCTWNGVFVPSATLVSTPPLPFVTRHMHWAPTGRKVALVAQFQAPNTGLQSGILVVDLERNPISVTLIRATTQASVDHLENFFISPDGLKIVFNRTVGSRETIFLSSVDEADEISLGEGHIIAGAANQEAWPLSPWSHDGTRLLFQSLNDGALWVMNRHGSAQARLTPEGVPGFFKVPDAQWVDFDAHASDLSITDIRPIQVIEGAPLILGKATMVRVFVQLRGSTQVENVTVKLNFGGQAFPSLTRTVVTDYYGVTYVLPAERVPDFYAHTNDPTYILANYVRKGFTSFNFFDKFLTPRATGPITISATLDPQQELSDSEDVEKDNNFRSMTAPVKAYRGITRPNARPRFSIQFQPATTLGGTPFHTLTTEELRAKAKVWSDFLLATFPVPEVNLIFIASTATILKVGGPVGVSFPVGLITGQGVMNNWMCNIDRTVYILPEGGVSVFPFQDVKGLADPIMGYGVLLDETAEDFALAHEVDRKSVV